MTQAIQDVRNKIICTKKAAMQYKVPYTTLRRRVNSNKNPEEASKKVLGRFRPVFTKEQEKELVEFILDMESRLFGLSTKELRHLAFQYAEKNGIPHHFNKVKGLAGRDWIYGFLDRNKNISLRLPEYTSIARASSFNKYNVNSFFNLLGDMLKKYKFPPSRIFNCDETGVSTVPNRPSRIFSAKGKKQVGSLSSAERGSLTTAEICFNAVGFYLPPLLIFPRVRRCPALEQGLPPESIVEYHSSGWMQSHIFSDVWFNHFLKYSKPTEADPVLLIFDGHATHTKNLTLVEKARANHVHIIVIPPHTSHRLQPLDVAFMFPLNTYYEQETKKWLINNPGKAITIYQVGELFGNAFQRAATAQNAINGFKATGIYPYNPNVFPEELFKPAETTDRSLTEERSNTPIRIVTDQNTVAVVSHPSPGLSITRTPSPQPGCSKARTPSPQPGCSIDRTPSPQLRFSTTPSSQHLPPITSDENIASLYYSPKDIMPLPKVGETTVPKRNVKRGKTMVLTSTPNYEDLKNNTTLKIPKKKKQVLKRNLVKPKVTRKVSKVDSDTSSDSSTEIKLQSSDDSDGSDFEFYPKPKLFRLDKINLDSLKINDFVLTELTSEKRTKKQFVAQITNIEKGLDPKIFVSFLRQYRQSTDIFVFPEVKDVSEVLREEILGKLEIDFLRHGKVKVF